VTHPGQLFLIGSTVQIVGQKELKEFLEAQPKGMRHPLKPEQVEYGGMSGKVIEARMYQGGAIAYVLENIPGAWHQALVRSP